MTAAPLVLLTARPPVPPQLATTYLLDILSNGNRPWVVAKHINNLLQGVKTLALTGEPANTLVACLSNEGEELKLDKKVTPTLALALAPTLTLKLS